MTLCITLSIAEAMSARASDQFALKRTWENYPMKKDLVDLRRLIEAVPSGGKILDLGCGHGQYASDFLTLGFDYVGVDNSPKMIAIARKENPKARFEVMSLNNLEFEPKTFAGIWSCCSITTTPKANFRRSLRRIRDCLAPCGSMLTVIPWTEEACEDVFPTSSGDLLYATYSPKEFRDLFINSGFGKVSYWQDPSDYAMSILATK
jgi:SAM-dependent methyltransferase